MVFIALRTADQFKPKSCMVWRETNHSRAPLKTTSRQATSDHWKAGNLMVSVAGSKESRSVQGRVLHGMGSALRKWHGGKSRLV